MGRCFNKLKKRTLAYKTMKQRLERAFTNNRKLLIREGFDCIIHRRNMIKIHIEEQKVEGQF